MPRQRDFIDDFLDGLKEAAMEFAEDFVHERLAPPKPPREPRTRRKNIKPPEVKTPKTPKPAKRERAEPTLYQILGVDAKAEPEVIEAAWKAKARLYHPDRNKSANAAAKMQAVNAAHDVLGKPEARKVYDRDLKIREAR